MTCRVANDKTQRHFMCMRVIVVEYDGGSGNGGVVVLAMVDPDHTTTTKKKKTTKTHATKTGANSTSTLASLFFFFSLSLHSRSTCGTIAAAAVGLARYDDMCTRLMSEGLSPSLSLSGEGLPFFKNNFHENRPSFAFLRFV